MDATSYLVLLALLHIVLSLTDFYGSLKQFCLVKCSMKQELVTSLQPSSAFKVWLFPPPSSLNGIIWVAI